ncbi:MAG: penicillin-binding protein [Candidatus Alcyoniella australis]|nr:penicillin-binding protein [Candidatus Alcyoniella australis]
MSPRNLPRARKMARNTRGRDWVVVRIKLTSALFVLGLAVLLGRALWLCVLDSEDLKQRADQMQRSNIELTCPRGPILDRNGEVLAHNIDQESLFVDPLMLPDELKPELARQLALVLDLQREDVAARLEREVRGRPARFAWIKRHIDRHEAQMVRRIVEELGVQGVHLHKESHRQYPQNTLAAHVLGFVDIDSKGLSGLEQSFDQQLRGRPGRLIGHRDALGRIYFPEGMQVVGSEPGATLRLTLDSKIQAIAERELDKAFVASEARAAMLVMIDVHTGEILALVNRPTFNPNVAGAFPPEYRRNRVLCDRFEPGSVMKTFTYAAAIESGAVDPEELIDCENGKYVFARNRINDVHPHGKVSARDVVKISSNIGATKIAERLGPELLHCTLTDFGFGRPTGVDMPHEAAGVLRSLERWAKVDLATHSFGQGLSVTAMQLVTALSASVNGGVLLKPYIVHSVVSPEGREIYRGHLTIRSHVISEETCREVLRALVSVTDDEGTGTLAALPYCRVAGKTGTAEKPYTDRRGYSDDVVATFIGTVPAEDPRIAVAVVFDAPQQPAGSLYGGVIAAPVFRAVADETMAYLRMIPGQVEPGADQEVQLARADVPQLVDGGLPDFTGLPVRQAYALAERSGIRLKTEGSGVCVSQVPGPGSMVARGERVLVRFADPAGEQR